MIEVDVVTPSRRLVVGAKTPEVKVPAGGGEITILPGHTDLLTTLGTGILSFKEDGQERKFAVSYGFAEVRKDRVLVLAETCEESTDIDVERAKAAQKKAEAALSGTLPEGTFRKHELKLQRSMIRQQISE